MDEELMEKTDEGGTGADLFGRILGAIKRNILLIILIVVLCVCGGAVFIRVKKPTYTASNVVTFTATSTATGNSGITGNLDSMTANLKSVVDFCKSDVVADRAEYYYVNFLTEKETDADLSVYEYVKAMGIYENVGDKLAEDPAYDYETYFKDKIVASKGYKDVYGEDDSHFDEYVEHLLAQDYDVSYGEFRYFMAARKEEPTLTLTQYMSRFATFGGTYYTTDAVAARKNISAGLVSTSVGNDRYTSYFTVSYKDGTPNGAINKLAIIDFAIDIEINKGYTDGVNTEKYFNGIKISIKPSTDPEIKSDTSKIMIILVSACIGIALAALVIYLKQLLDNTMKDKDELEAVTGRPIIAFIADREEV